MIRALKAMLGGSPVVGGSKPITLKPPHIVISGKTHALRGVQAVVLADGTQRMTATRVAVGTVLAPGIGTAIGAIAKKKQHALVITGASWSETVAFKDAGKAALAARQINAAAARL